MNFDISFYVFINFCINMQSEATSTAKQCYKAKTCVHNNLEKCGVSSNGTPRRFLDTCDIFEFNCLKGTDYRKSLMENCRNLQSLYKVKNLKWGYDSHELNAQNAIYANNFDTDNYDEGFNKNLNNNGGHPSGENYNGGGWNNDENENLDYGSYVGGQDYKDEWNNQDYGGNMGSYGADMGGDGGNTGFNGGGNGDNIGMYGGGMGGDGANIGINGGMGGDGGNIGMTGGMGADGGNLEFNGGGIGDAGNTWFDAGGMEAARGNMGINGGGMGENGGNMGFNGVGMGGDGGNMGNSGDYNNMANDKKYAYEQFASVNIDHN